MNHERVHPRLVLQNRCGQVLAVLDDVRLDLDFLVLDDPLVLVHFVALLLLFQHLVPLDLVLQSWESHFHLLDDWC